MAKEKRTHQQREQDAFLMEVKDEIRHEKTMEFLKKWGRLFTVCAVLILVFVVSHQLVKNYRVKGQLKEAQIFANASSQSLLLNSTKLTEEFEKLAKDGKYGYQAIAYFQLIDQEISKNNIEGAKNLLKEASLNIKEKELRDLASLKLAYLSADTWTIDQAKEAMSDLLSKSSPFYYSASSLFGFICLHNKDIDQAKKTFEKIVNDENSPEDVKIFSANALSAIK